MMTPTLATSVGNEAAALLPEGEHSRLGVVTRAAGEGPRDAGIDGQCESAHEADSGCNDSRRTSKEAEPTGAAGEGPRDAGIDGQCESAHEADSGCNDSRRTSKEAEPRGARLH